MLDRARDEVAPASGLESLRGAANREVVRLGSPAREHNLGGVAPHQRRDRRSRLVERRFGLLAEVVHTRGVPIQIPHGGRHRVDDRRGQWRRRVVVEIDTHRERYMLPLWR